MKRAQLERLQQLIAGVQFQANVAERADRRLLKVRTYAVRKLHANGYSLRDIGALLGISHQRVHQLLKGGEQ